MSPSEATDAQVLRLMRASLALWRIGATIETAPEGGWRVITDAGGVVRIGRASPDIPFRWMIVTDTDRERPASSMTGLLRVLRSVLDPDWRPGRARVVSLTLPAESFAEPLQPHPPAQVGQSPVLNQRPHPAPDPSPSRRGETPCARLAEDPRVDSIVPVTVLTGFLGSGKTTLLARLLKSPEFARTAVIINEFGEIGIDHDLVTPSRESFVTLETGCICCVVRGDLEATLADLVARRAMGELPTFERVVIETSGLADPAPVLNAVMAETGRGAGVALEGVVTTVDALAGLQTLEREPQAARQVAIADRLVVTKVDLADGGPTPDLIGRLRALNPHARPLLAVSGDVPPAVVIGSGRSHRFPDAAMPPGWDHKIAHDTDIACVAIRRGEPVPALALPLFLEALADHIGTDLLRLKALVRVAEDPLRPAVLHGVQHLFHEPQWLDAWPSDDHDTRMVLIGRGLSQLWIEALLEAIVAEVAELASVQPPP